MQAAHRGTSASRSNSCQLRSTHSPTMARTACTQPVHLASSDLSSTINEDAALSSTAMPCRPAHLARARLAATAPLCRHTSLLPLIAVRCRNG